MKLLPTPRLYRYGKERTAFTGFSGVHVHVDGDDTLAVALQSLKERFDFAEENGPQLHLYPSTHLFFKKKNAAEQGYILKKKGNVVELYAQSTVGFLYGAMTLLQMHGDAPAEFEIYDRPQIRFRGNMNSLWAETGVWTYDFGDGLENAVARLKQAIDDGVRAKLNVMYVDAFGFRSERFPGYNDAMKEISEYARVRGMRMIVGGYGMGYGLSGHGENMFMGKVFYNRRPYPDGEVYDCIGTCTLDPYEDPQSLAARSFGTCLSNRELTLDKAAEVCEYLTNTGVSMAYMHNMDSDEIHEPLWLARCDRCRELYPNDDLYARDGAAGAFADFYDTLLERILSEHPDFILCGISPGYAYAVRTEDGPFEKCRRFWSAIMAYMKHTDHFIPIFRELYMQHEEPILRFDLLEESMEHYGCANFPGGDGFYSDKIYVPAAAYVAAMRGSEMMLFANGGALQKPTQYANAEYCWNPDRSAFWNVDIPQNYPEQIAQYNALRFGSLRPEGIYGQDGLLETSCCYLFGKEHGKRIADVFRLQGKNGECPVFTPCNVEIWTRCNEINFPMLWDTPVNEEKQALYRERFFESAKVTHRAEEILTQVLEEELAPAVREHLAYLKKCSTFCGALCDMLWQYMDVYMQADAFLAGKAALPEGFAATVQTLREKAEKALEAVRQEGYRPFDLLGGVMIRREEVLDMIAYSAGQILQSVDTGSRVPPQRRELIVKYWW